MDSGAEAGKTDSGRCDGGHAGVGQEVTVALDQGRGSGKGMAWGCPSAPGVGSPPPHQDRPDKHMERHHRKQAI